jgi:hypothetical protein
MPDLLVRDIDPEVYERMKKAAESQGKSLAQTARETLAEKFTPSRREAWARIDAFRESVGPVPGNSVEVIRKAREWPRS